METVLPEGWEKMTLDNKTDLRYCMREKDGRGFIFMINAQDHDSLPFVKRDIPRRFLPDFSKGPVLDIKEVRVVPEYKASVKF